MAATQGEEVARVPCLGRLNGGPWGLRRRVPAELREELGKTEIVKSYRTESFAEARRRHPLEMALVEAMFEDARHRLAVRQKAAGQPGRLGTITAQAITPNEGDIRAAVDAWLHAASRKHTTTSDLAALNQEELEDNLNVDETHLAGSEGLDAAARQLTRVLGACGLGPPQATDERFAQAYMQRAMLEEVRRYRDHVPGRIGGRSHDGHVHRVSYPGLKLDDLTIFER